MTHRPVTPEPPTLGSSWWGTVGFWKMPSAYGGDFARLLEQAGTGTGCTGAGIQRLGDTVPAGTPEPAARGSCSQLRLPPFFTAEASARHLRLLTPPPLLLSHPFPISKADFYHLGKVTSDVCG